MDAKNELEKTVIKPSKNHYNLWGAITSFTIALVAMIEAYNKMTQYVNYDDVYSLEETVNYWVDGDAYNFIISGTHSTTIMVFALSFVILGCTLLVIYNTNRKVL